MSEDQHPTAPTEPEATALPEQGHHLAVVGIGGSAGALDGYERFFLGLPPASGLAYVVVSHLDPQHRGLMPDILERCTTMPVVQITSGMPLMADRVHVIPPGHSLSVMNGLLLLEDLALAGGMVIDSFFEALAADQRDRAVAIVLSGMGTDGTLGLQAIKRNGGLVLVQDPLTAEYSSMPRSAAASQLANDVLPAEELASRLMALVEPSRALQLTEAPGDGASGVPLQKILRLVRARTGHDFSRYKRSTLVRRIERRIRGHRIQGVDQYIRLLQDSPAELDALFQDFTINVTSFFRDSDAFEALKEHLRRYILTSKAEHDTFRVWVAGCATGEEAYSVAIVLHELMDELGEDHRLKIQVFATDIDKVAVDKARGAVYPKEISYVISPERLSRFFLLKDDHYQVHPEVRNSVVFAVHSTFNDPPFTRLDLLCCRNMLIYVGPELQKQIMALFLYALLPKGLLFLGASETIGSEREQFSTLDQRWRIYQRGESLSSPMPLDRSIGRSSFQGSIESIETEPPRPVRTADLAQQAQRALLSEYAPPAVVVNELGDILFVHGRTARYLELSPGKVSNNIFEMAQGDLRYELPTAVRQSVAEHRRVTRSGLQVEASGQYRTLDLIVKPIQHPGSGLVIVIFQEHQDVSGDPVFLEKPDHVRSLEEELQHGKEFLQATVEEMAVSMEEIRSTNEELQTTNEELQSSNEELMTSKEELQSLNEELITINAEHQRIIHDLAQANDDMKNLLESAGIATVFLGNDLKIKRFTPRISQIINLMPIDAGRPLTDISVNLRYEHLTRDITQVLETLEAFEAQVQTHDDEWYLMRVSPYRTSDNFIDGVVVTFTNIDLIKSLERQLTDSMRYAEMVLNSMRDPLVILDQHLRVVTVNRALLDLLNTTRAEVHGERLYDIGQFVFDQPELQARLREVIVSDRPLSNYLIDLNLRPKGPRKFKVEAELVVSEDGQSDLFMMKLEDVTSLLHRAALEGEDISGDTPDPQP